MVNAIRSAILVAAALTASTVAPAQVQPSAEPLIYDGTNATPAIARVEPMALLDDELSAPEATTPKRDPLAPVEVPQTADISDDDQGQAKPTGTLAEKVAQMRSSVAGSSELECLAGAIYFESKSEPLQGQLAVGHVIANRAKSGRFPSSYCGVVYQRSQFSFIRGRTMPPIARSSMQWKNAVAIAKIVDGKLQDSPVGKAMFFHARRVSPGWRLTRVGTVGNHIFYR